MPVLVSGSVALDHIMVFPDRFKNHILPDKLHTLNVSFNITSLETHFGGVAGNMAWHLKFLGEEPYVLATVGDDFAPYAEWLDRYGIRQDWIKRLEGMRTPQGFVTTDLDDNQIWAFHEGAMSRAEEAKVEDVGEPYEMAIVSANGRRAMVEHARALKARGTPVLIDPSHALPILERAELRELIAGASIYIVNDYEWSLTIQRTGLSEDELRRSAETIVVTNGEKGASILQGEGSIEIPAVAASQVVDPTGAGDAFRAGLVYGRQRGLPFETAGRIASLMGSLQVECEGTQTLPIDRAGFSSRYEREFGDTI